MTSQLIRIFLLLSLLSLGNPAVSSAPAHMAAASEGSAQYLPLIAHRFPPLPTVFGVEMWAIAPNEGLDAVAQAGSYWTHRNGVDWARVEPVEGQRDWSALAALENELLNAAARGLEVILIVRGTPDWAQRDGVACGPIKTSEFGAFADFMHALVQRYSGPPYNVRYWEIWNEPDIQSAAVAPDEIYGCWGDPADPFYGGGYYAEMLRVVYPMIKAADPDADVLVGGLLLDCDDRLPGACNGAISPGSARFLEGVLRRNGANDGAAYFDGVSFHAYDFYKGGLGQYHNPNWASAWNTSGPTVAAKARFIRELLDAYGAGAKYLINTEGALLCGGPFDPPGGLSCSSEPTSPFEITKAYYVAQLYAAALAEGLHATLWFTATGWRNSGLLNADLSPRPAYHAFNFAQSTLRDSNYLGPLTGADLSDPTGIQGHKFDRGDRIIWVLWSQDGSARSVSLAPGAPLTIHDAMGNPEVPANPMIVDLTPRYLEWKP